MEGGIHRGRWNKKSHAGIILLLMCMFVPALTLEPPGNKTCEYWEYRTEKGICCDRCHPGSKLLEECPARGQRSKCVPCPPRQYTDMMNYSPNCRSCRHCKKSNHEVEQSPCERDKNTICRCEDGYYRQSFDSDTHQCLKCKKCDLNQKETQNCTSESNTVCECTDKYYELNSKCESCKNCHTDCEHHCPTPPTLEAREDPDTGIRYHTNILVGVAAVSLVSLLAVVAVTNRLTKWSTKKKMLKSSSQSSEVSTDACEQVLIHSGEPSTFMSLLETSDKACPPSSVCEPEQPSNLPDCVPFEIKVSELIYSVLDLVPVLQVKQLVRTLGVEDSKIEQLELDYRTCREAHYQMLRVWAEKGTRAGGMLHWSLLQELLDELGKMHLGRAAEELEAKYGIL